MVKKVSIVLVSILIAFVFMTSGYGLWQKNVTIEGNITIEPDPKIIESLESEIEERCRLINALLEEKAKMEGEKEKLEEDESESEKENKNEKGLNSDYENQEEKTELINPDNKEVNNDYENQIDNEIVDEEINEEVNKEDDEVILESNEN